MKKHQSKFYPFKSIKTFVYVLIVLAFISYAAFVVASSLRNGDSTINYSGIEITTNNDASVYVDNVKIGNVKSSESFLYTKIIPGNKRLKIQKDNDVNTAYEKDIIFEKGAKVTVDWTFGVTNETSSGLVKYFIKKSEDKNKIRIISSTAKTNIIIDGQNENSGTIDSDNSEHTVEVTKDGYISKILKLSLASNENKISGYEQQKYEQYDLVVEVSLFQIPFD